MNVLFSQFFLIIASIFVTRNYRLRQFEPIHIWWPEKVFSERCSCRVLNKCRDRHVPLRRNSRRLRGLPRRTCSSEWLRH